VGGREEERGLIVDTILDWKLLEYPSRVLGLALLLTLGLIIDNKSLRSRTI
jgi:hypothetical protein